MSLGKFYYIASKMNGLVLDIEGGSNDPGTPVIMWGKKDDEPDNQLWYNDLDTRTIRSKQNGMCLTTRGHRLVVDEYEDGDDNQKWIFIRQSGLIRNGDDRDQVLDIVGGESDKGAHVCAWGENGKDNQQWDCERVAARFFVIKSLQTGLIMGPKRKSERDGAKVQMFEPDEVEDTLLWWEDENNIIRNKATGYALMPKDDDEGCNIRCVKFDDGEQEQAWIRAGKNLIINRFNRDRALDVKGGDDDDGAEVIVWDRHGKDNQQFDFQWR